MFSHNGFYGARGVENISAGAALKPSSHNFQRIHQTATRCFTLSSYTVAAECERGGGSLMSTIAMFRKNDISNYNSGDKNSSGDEIANVNFYAVRPEATRIL